MRRPEFLARLLVVALCTGAVLIPLVVRFGNAGAVEIHGKVPEAGGWSIDSLQARAGEPLHLRLTSDDVFHGFAVGHLDMPSVDLEPGKMSEVSLTFEEPGTYTFYCTRWCGLNHWRMRGTIEVSGEDPNPPATTLPPLYVRLGINIDAPHLTEVTPSSKPSAKNGAALAADLPISRYTDPEYYRTYAPAQTFQDLRADPALEALSDEQVWDVVAYTWQANTTPGKLAEGQQLYAENCAACHGEAGAGDGIYAKELIEAGEASLQEMSGSHAMSTQKPADFSNPANMLGASPALLEGKILRGGMGTGMPMWGVIFTDEQIWNIISFLYTFQFEETQNR